MNRSDEPQQPRLQSSFYVSEKLKDFGSSASQLFDTLDRLEGEIYRQVETRRTFRFEQSGETYFAKLHYGVGWKEIIKNLLQFRLPILGARNEQKALVLLDESGIPVPELVGFGLEGRNPATRHSCIVTKSLINTLSLEDCCRQNLMTPSRKYPVIRRVAELARRMHEVGVNHRDCYICHFHLSLEGQNFREPELFVIDLHRAHIRDHTPTRWRVKDVGSLLFSAVEEDAINRNDLFRFMQIYSNKPLRQTLHRDDVFWKKVKVRAQRLYLKNHKQLHPLLM